MLTRSEFSDFFPQFVQNFVPKQIIFGNYSGKASLRKFHWHENSIRKTYYYYFLILISLKQLFVFLCTLAQSYTTVSHLLFCFVVCYFKDGASQISKRKTKKEKKSPSVFFVLFANTDFYIPRVNKRKFGKERKKRITENVFCCCIEEVNKRKLFNERERGFLFDCVCHKRQLSISTVEMFVGEKARKS